MELVAVESVTLDGVMQAPGRPDEDERGGFAHGGWAVPYNDPVMGRAMGERMARGGALLLHKALVRALARAGLVDEFVLLVHPLTLGAGQRLFDGVDATLRLVDTLTTTKGVIIATYRTSEEER